MVTGHPRSLQVCLLRCLIYYRVLQLVLGSSSPSMPLSGFRCWDRDSRSVFSAVIADMHYRPIGTLSCLVQDLYGCQCWVASAVQPLSALQYDHISIPCLKGYRLADFWVYFPTQTVAAGSTEVCIEIVADWKNYTLALFSFSMQVLNFGTTTCLFSINKYSINLHHMETHF